MGQTLNKRCLGRILTLIDIDAHSKSSRHQHNDVFAQIYWKATVWYRPVRIKAFPSQLGTHLSYKWSITLQLFVQVLNDDFLFQKLNKALIWHQSSVRPKSGFSIGNRNQGPILVSVSEPNFFFSETETFKFFSFFPTSWDSTSFYKLGNKPRSSKII